MNLLKYILISLNSINNLYRDLKYKLIIPNRGKNIIIGRNFTYSNPENIYLGNNIYISHDVEFITNNSRIIVGNYVLIGPYTLITTSNYKLNKINKPIYTQGIISKIVNIADDVWIGAHVSILSGVKIGKGAVIGAGSVVTKDIPPYAVAVGVPAKVIKYRIKKKVNSR